MRSLYKISLAILAVGILAVAGSAFAQDAKPTLTISGDAGAGFGSFSFDKSAVAPAAGATPANTKAYSEFVTSWESNVRFTWATDQFQSIVRYRIRGSNEGSGTNSTLSQSGSAFQSASNDVYGEAWWTPGAFKLGVGKFQGQGWSQPMSGAYLITNPIGDAVYWMNWTGIAGLDAEYNLGTVQVGVAVSSQCRPSCNAAANSSTVGNTVKANTIDNNQSIVPHVTGKFGDISIAAQFPSTSATVNNSATNTPITGTADKTKAVSGSGYQVGVKYAASGLSVGLDISSFTDDKVADFGQLKSRQRDGLGVRVDVPAGPGPVTIAYFQIDDNNSANGKDAYGVSGATATSNTYTTTETTVRYSYPVGTLGWVIPEYRATTVGGALAPTSGTKQTDASHSEFRLVMQGRF